LTNMLRGKTAMAGLDLVEVKKAIARAPRKERDAANKQRRMGGNVASFMVQLLTWEGSGELDDYYIHRTKREWFESEAALTESMVKTARTTADEEGLVEFETGYRPRDRRPTTLYRVNMWELAKLVNRSELENTERLLKHETRKRERDKLNKKRCALEAARDDLSLLGERDSGNPEPELEPGQDSRVTRSTSPAYRRSPQEEFRLTHDSPEGTLLSSDSSVVGGDKNAAPDPSSRTNEEKLWWQLLARPFRPETEEAMRVIYSQLKRAGIEVKRYQYAAMKCDLDRGEYPADLPEWLAEELILHYEATGEVDHDAAWALVDPDHVPF